jgi:hypothetical protein
VLALRRAERSRGKLGVGEVTDRRLCDQGTSPRCRVPTPPWNAPLHVSPRRACAAIDLGTRPAAEPLGTGDGPLAPRPHATAGPASTPAASAVARTPFGIARLARSDPRTSSSEVGGVAGNREQASGEQQACSELEQ